MEEVAVPASVEVTGVRGFEDAKGYISDAGVYLATTRETFGIGTLEELAAGVPIVGWAWGGVRVSGGRRWATGCGPDVGRRRYEQGAWLSS